MLKALFSSKEMLSHNLGYCKLFDVKYNGRKATKIYFVSHSPQAYEVLRNNVHLNILPVYKITQHSIFTKRIVPFSEVFDKQLVAYNKYVLKRIKSSLHYLHTQLKIEHNNLMMDALFVDDCGNVILSKFERCRPFESAKDDDNLLNSLCKDMLGSPLSSVDLEGNIFESIERASNFNSFNDAEKRAFVAHMLANKSELIKQVKENVFKVLFDSIGKTECKEYNVYIVQSLMSFDLEIFRSHYKYFFGIIDSAVRLFLLKNFKDASEMSDAANEIALGLRVKDKVLRNETIVFLFNNEKCFNTKAFEGFLASMAESIDDSDSIGLICLRLSEIQRSDVCGAIYKLAIAFLHHNKNKGLVYKLIEEHFERFEKFKVSSELLPLLCSKLSDKEDQDKCFILVERILNYLKRNKNEIYAKEWSLKSLKGMLFTNKKPENDPTMSQKMSKISREDASNEWEDQDF